MTFTRLVHKSGVAEGEPCMISPLDYDDMICVHGFALVEQNMPVFVPQRNVPIEMWVKSTHYQAPA